jgi:hypothetical protein
MNQCITPAFHPSHLDLSPTHHPCVGPYIGRGPRPAHRDDLGVLAQQEANLPVKSAADLADQLFLKPQAPSEVDRAQQVDFHRRPHEIGIKSHPGHWRA